jgi:3-deoxy-D-manno-octulosonate 8-phosphate phosphatase (KDO 8-P phosphatase)
MRARTKAQRIALMGFDVDGVLTDGSLYFGRNDEDRGEEFKVFSSLDGHGIKLLNSVGIEVVLISGRRSRALELRAANLGIKELHMGISGKRDCMADLLTARQLDFSAAGYMGDDIVDLGILSACGFSATPSDGHIDVRRRVDYVCRASGGRGAVREVCDLIIDAHRRMGDVLAAALREATPEVPTTSNDAGRSAS